jgi:hypothetical protein
MRNLPSVHVRQRDGTPDAAGLAIMERIVARRYSAWHEMFTSAQLQRMALMTGGDLRDFFRFVGECLVQATSLREATLPLPDTVVENAENQLRREMLPIAVEDATWLQRIATSKQPELESIALLSRLARLFDTHMVLNYRNAEDWYDVHPLLHGELGETFR